MKNVGNSSRGRSQGFTKIFRAPMYRAQSAHCAVIFAIAQLSCCFFHFCSVTSKWKITNIIVSVLCGCFSTYMNVPVWRLQFRTEVPVSPIKTWQWKAPSEIGIGEQNVENWNQQSLKLTDLSKHDLDRVQSVICVQDWKWGKTHIGRKSPKNPSPTLIWRPLSSDPPQICA